MSTDKGEMADLVRLAQAIKHKNTADTEIARIAGRPAERGHVGEYIAARVFGIALEPSASHKGVDGRFVGGNLARKSVNVKWYGKMEGLLDVTLGSQPDFYLVLAGPKAAALSSRGLTRPWIISYVYLFDSTWLLEELKALGVKIGVATSIRSYLWERAEIYPVQRSLQLSMSEEQKKLISLFS